jgi:hypothetical protein
MARDRLADIRCWKGSQAEAFEELCCQLAAAESVPAGSRWVRVRGSGGDGGVECYWVLPNGEEYAWQSKYFIDGPVDDGRWRQLDASVHAALETHPQLTRYTVCLPMNLTGPRQAGGRSQVEKWEERAAGWLREAEARGMRVDFVLWGETEVWDRLARQEHRGRRAYWFAEDEFSTEWFQRSVEKVKKSVGPRYTPEENVDLPLYTYFEGLGQTEAYCRQADELRGELCRHWRATQRALNEAGVQKVLGDQHEPVAQLVPALIGALRAIAPDPSRPIPAADIARTSGECETACWDCCELLTKGVNPREVEEWAYAFQRLWQTCRKIRLHFASPASLLAESPALLLTGEAGSGKTHLLCHVAEQRVAAEQPTILLLGQHLDARLPTWRQAAEELGLAVTTTAEELLGALQAAAQAANARALLMIDAVNESEHKENWETRLPALRTEVNRYSPWIGLAVTCRSTYRDYIVPRECRMVERQHQGFASLRLSDLAPLFGSHGLQMPKVPLLHPEFRNPLFVRVFCQVLAGAPEALCHPDRSDLHEVFRKHVDMVNDKVCRDHGYRGTRRLVSEAISRFAGRLAAKRARQLPVTETQQLLDAIPPPREFDGSLYRALCDENILMEDRLPGPSHRGGDTEAVSFAFERTADHMVVSALLCESLDAVRPAQSFGDGGPLSWIVADEQAAWADAGLIEELCLQVPERTGREFPDLGPWGQYDATKQAFLEALPWRHADRVSDAAVHCLSRLLRDSAFTGAALDVLLRLAPTEHHRLNADFLHKVLLAQRMPVRDEFWSQHYLMNVYETDSPVARLLEWAETQDITACEGATVRLCGIALAWFLTATDRQLRDRATKALARLLSDRLAVASEMLRMFAGADDPYVVERLYAAAYGSALRSSDAAGLSALARQAYLGVFADRDRVPHILLRDYARGVIEVARVRGLQPPGLDLGAISPPYQSMWPLRCPSEERLRRYGNGYEGIRSSLLNGDFGVYVIGDNDTRVSDFDFPLDRAQRWVFNRVVKLGWTPGRFGEADRALTLRSVSRGPRRRERMGKKYQWIATHELLAKVADHCACQPYGPCETIAYEGPWQIWRRDIDPSVSVREESDAEERRSSTWWSPVCVDFTSLAASDDADWLGSASDLPAAEELIEVRKREQSETWLALQGYYHWEDVAPLEYERYECSTRAVRYQLRSYIVRSRDAQGLLSWLERQHFHGRWMPESVTYHQVFAGEYPWAPSCETSRREWVSIGPRNADSPDCQVVVTAEEMPSAFEYDFSTAEPVSAIVPAPYLVRGMNLIWRPPYRFADAAGRTVVFCPRTEESEPRALLVEANALHAFLEREDLCILWTLLGEKNIVGGHEGGFRGRLEVSGVYRTVQEGVAGQLTHRRCIPPQTGP